MKSSFPQIHLKDSIATRLFKVVFSLYVVVSILLTALHMFTEYLNTKQEVRRELEALHQIVRQGLTHAFFDADLFQVQDILDGIATSPSILGCKLDDTMGNTVQQAGKILEKETNILDADPEEHVYREDKATGVFFYEFPLIYSYETQNIQMGSLFIYSGNDVIFQKVKSGFASIVVNAIIKTIVLWIIFLYFSRIMLRRPLSILTAATEQVNPNSLESFQVDVGTRGRNELKILEEAFNSMVRKLYEANAELRDYAKKLDRSLRQLDDIVNNSPAVIFVKDTTGRYMLVNREFERVFHVSRDGVLGKTGRDTLPSESADFFMADDKEAITGNRPVESEVNISLDDGVHTYICTLFPLHDAQNNIYGICGIATDISERIAAEKLLKNFNENLKQEVDLRTNELRIANLRLKRQQVMLEHLASIDGLTGIPNRRQFDDSLDREWRRALRSGKPVALIMMDIDHFKKFNDHYGHAAGDECLRNVAQTLARSLGRASDSIARYGGEEFAAILPGASEESAKAVAEKMRVNIESLNIPHVASEVSNHVTLSLGIALFIPTRETSPRNLIEMADNALYQAKTDGRNQVKFAEDMRHLKEERA